MNHFEDEMVLKCLEEHLADYLREDAEKKHYNLAVVVFSEINRVRDQFVLDDMHFNLVSKRLIDKEDFKKGYNKYMNDEEFSLQTVGADMEGKKTEFLQKHGSDAFIKGVEAAIKVRTVNYMKQIDEVL